MEPDPARGTFDRDLDVPRRHWEAPPVESISSYQRLVANPLLAIMAGIAVVGLIELAIHFRHLPLFLISLGLLILPYFLIQFHCLDCGATGWFVRYRRHECPAILMRWQSHEPPHPRGLSLPRQVSAWLASLILLLLLYAILFGIQR